MTALSVTTPHYWLLFRKEREWANIFSGTRNTYLGWVKYFQVIATFAHFIQTTQKHCTVMLLH